jgi:hypothetical protein
MKLSRFAVISAFVAAFSVPLTCAAANYTEAVDGDLSGVMGAPTAFALAQGSNSLTATTVSGDEDYVAITVPAGQVLLGITLSAYSGATKSFIGIQKGAVFTVPANTVSAAGLLGWAHFGVTGTTASLGTDILDDMGRGEGATGFIPPLASGTYAIWLHETGAVAVTYTLTFNVIPTPPPPVVKVNGKKTIQTTRPRLTFRGSVRGYSTLVEYRIAGKGGFKPAKGLPNWSFNAAGLKHGRTVITVRARGVGGTSKVVRIVVIRN